MAHPFQITTGSNALRAIREELRQAASRAKLLTDVPEHRRLWAVAFAYEDLVTTVPLTFPLETREADTITFQHRLLDGLGLVLSASLVGDRSQIHVPALVDQIEVNHAKDALMIAMDEVVINDAVFDFESKICFVESPASDIIRIVYPKNPAVGSAYLDHSGDTRDLSSLMRKLDIEIGDLAHSFRFGSYTGREMSQVLRLIVSESLQLIRKGKPAVDKRIRRWASRLARQLVISRQSCEAILRDLTFDRRIGKADIQPLIPIDKDNVILIPLLLFGINLPVMVRRLWSKLYPQEYSRTFGSRKFTRIFEEAVRKCLRRIDGLVVVPEPVEVKLRTPTRTSRAVQERIEVDIVAFDRLGSTLILGEAYEALLADTAEEWAGFREKLDMKAAQLRDTLDCLEMESNFTEFLSRIGLGSRPDQILPMVVSTGGYVTTRRLPITILSLPALHRLVDSGNNLTSFIGKILVGDLYPVPPVEHEEFSAALNYSGVIPSLGWGVEIAAWRGTLAEASMMALP